MFSKSYYNRIANLTKLRDSLVQISTELQTTEKVYQDAYNSYLCLTKYRQSTQVYTKVVSYIQTTEMTINWNETKKSKYNYTVIAKKSTDTIETMLKQGKNGALKKTFEQNKTEYDKLVANINEAVSYYKLLSDAAVNE
jgi:hypothetical protein